MDIEFEQGLESSAVEPRPVAPAWEEGGFPLHGSARSLFISAAAHRRLLEMEPRWREIALEALQTFADNAALWGTWADDPRLGWRELCLELNGVAIYYNDQPEPFVVFHIAIRPDGGGGGGGIAGFAPSFMLPPAFVVSGRAPLGVRLMSGAGTDDAAAWAARAAGGAHALMIEALSGRELSFLVRALTSDERLWIDPDAIFPMMQKTGNRFGIDVLRRQIWTHDFAALKTVFRDLPALTPLDGAKRKCEPVAVPFATDALQAWIEAAIMADWAPGRGWLSVERRALRKTSRALAAFTGTCLVGVDFFAGASGAARADVKLMSAGIGDAQNAAVVNASAWSSVAWGTANHATANDAQAVRSLHAMRVIALARFW